LYADYAVLFPERSLVTNLVPNRDIGIQVQGDVADGFVSYVGALFNGVPDGANGDLDTNSAKDLVGRVTVRPFAHAKRLGYLGFAVAGSNGQESGVLPSFKSTAQQTFFSYASGAVAAGDRTRLSPSAFYYVHSFGMFTEYARSTQAVQRGAISGDVNNTAWQVTGSIVATGETASERGVVPRRAFDPQNGQWGALQIAARYGRLEVDRSAFALGFAAAGASRTASAAGVEATWYLNANVKYVLSFERTVFDDDANGARKPEHALVFRLQLNLQPSL
jgi:phosphate-selective porin OprO/OprP